MEDNNISVNNKMDDKIINLIDNMKNKKTGNPISDKTKINYKGMYENLKKIDSDFFNKLLELQDNKKEFNALLRKVRNQVFTDKPQKDLNFARSKGYFIFISQIISLIPELKEKLTEYGDNRLEQYKKETFKQQENLQDDKVQFEKLKIKWSDYVKKVKELTDDDGIDLNDKILLNLYRFYPIRDNYGKVLLTDKDLDDDENFYNVKTKLFHLNNYKTKDTYGKQKFLIPDFISKMIKERYDEGNKFMISKTKDKTFGGKDGALKQYIQRITKKYFGSPFGVNDIRKSVIASFENKSIQSKRELAKRMLNSYTTQQEIYKRMEL